MGVLSMLDPKVFFPTVERLGFQIAVLSLIFKQLYEVNGDNREKLSVCPFKPQAVARDSLNSVAKI